MDYFRPGKYFLCSFISQNTLNCFSYQRFIILCFICPIFKLLHVLEFFYIIFFKRSFNSMLKIFKKLKKIDNRFFFSTMFCVPCRTQSKL